jgi:hypothetical protein
LPTYLNHLNFSWLGIAPSLGSLTGA